MAASAFQRTRGIPRKRRSAGRASCAGGPMTPSASARLRCTWTCSPVKSQAFNNTGSAGSAIVPRPATAEAARCPNPRDATAASPRTSALASANARMSVSSSLPARTGSCVARETAAIRRPASGSPMAPLQSPGGLRKSHPRQHQRVQTEAESGGARVLSGALEGHDFSFHPAGSRCNRSPPFRRLRARLRCGWSLRDEE